MPAVLVGVDLVALCAILLLIGLLTAVAYTFEILADELDISIFGTHPFRSLSNSIKSVIVANCERGIKALGTVAHDLWIGAEWAFRETVQAIMSIPNGVDSALSYLWKTAVPGYGKALIAPLWKEVNANATKLANAITEETQDVLNLGTQITDLAKSIPGTIDHKVSGIITSIRTDISSAINGLRTELTTDINSAVGTATTTASTALEAVRTAEQAAIGAIGAAEDATAAELRDFINNLDLRNIAEVVAAVPLVVAAVNILEAETGLGRAECRGKIKGICGTDPSAWTQLLGSLVLIELDFDLKDIIEAVVEFGSVSAGIIEEMVT